VGAKGTSEQGALMLQRSVYCSMFRTMFSFIAIQYRVASNTVRFYYLWINQSRCLMSNLFSRRTDLVLLRLVSVGRMGFASASVMVACCDLVMAANSQKWSRTSEWSSLLRRH
jgi:hypothetical protein